MSKFKAYLTENENSLTHQKDIDCKLQLIDIFGVSQEALTIALDNL